MTDENQDPNVAAPASDTLQDVKDGIKKKKSNYWKNKKNRNVNGQFKTSNFKGSIADMNGHTFECHGEAYSASQYHRTMEELQSYVLRTYKYGDDVCYVVRHLTEYNVDQHKPKYPPKLPDTSGALTIDPDVTDVEIWKREVDAFVKRRDAYRMNKMSLYMVVWGQCSEAMQAKIKALSNFDDIDKSRNCLKLLEEIKNIAFKFEAQGKYVHLALYEAKQAFYRNFQGKEQSNSQYLTKFKDICSIIEHYGGSIGSDPVLVREELERDNVPNADKIKTSDAEYIKRIKPAQQRFFAVAFLKGADRTRFGKLVTDLENQYTRGSNQYPKDITGAYNLLVNYKGYHNPRQDTKSNDKGNRDIDNSGVVFVQKAGDGKLYNKRGELVVCFVCGGNHFANDKECPGNKNKAESEDYFSGSTTVDDAIIFLTTHILGNEYDDVLETTLVEDVGACLLSFASKIVLTMGPSIHIDWILLDNQSNMDVFCNDKYLIDIGPSAHTIRAYGNGGSQDTSEQGLLPGYGRVWYNPKSIANILSFSNVEDKFPITYKKGLFRVHISQSKTMDFKRINNNLFVYMPNDECSSKEIFVFLQTVEGNQINYTEEEIAKAGEARRLYICLSRPSHRSFKYMLNHNLIKNCEVTAADAERALVIYGPDIGALRGKSVRTRVKKVIPPDIIPLPAQIKDIVGEITLCVDFFFVDKIPFLLSYARVIHFLMIEHTINRTKDTMVEYFTTVLAIYRNRGFAVRFVLGDNAFACLRDFFLRVNVLLSPTAATEHVADVERQIRLIKERIRGHISMSPFRFVPKLVKKELVLGTVTAINFIVRKNSVSRYLSPMTIVLGLELDARTCCQVPFGAYCEIDEFAEPRNSTELPRTLDAIALRPMHNFQGGYYFLKLDTWEVVHRWKWTELPMPRRIITVIEDRARREATLRDHSTSFTFLRRDRSILTSMLIDDSHLLDEFDPPEDEGAGDGEANPTAAVPPQPPVAHLEAAPIDNRANPGATPTDTPTIAPAEGHADDNSNNSTNEGAQESRSESSVIDPNTGLINELDHENDRNDDIESENNDTENDDVTIQSTDRAEATNTLDAMINNIDEENINKRNPKAKDDIIGDEVTEENILEEDYDEDRPGTARYNLRRKVPRFLEDEYVNLVQTMSPKAPEVLPFTDYGGRYGFALTQMSAAEGLRRFGDQAAEALIKEWKQLHNLEVFEGYNFSKMTQAQRASALRLVQLIKKKRCGKIKGRTCADGRKQRDYIDPIDRTSPTVALEALLLTLMIDAHERRHVATCDISGAFLKSDIDQLTFVVVDGPLVEMLLKSDPSYEKYVHTTRNGKRVVYLKLLKALYGTVRAARLFWENLTDKLKKFGFRVNPYDECVANMNMDGSQCTVCWHVDDLKISHKSKKVVDKVIQYLEGIFGEMNVVHGASHTYVGMDIHFPGNGTVKINSGEYIEEAIDEFPEDIGQAATPATSTLFEINESGVLINEASREIFHRIVAKLLYVTQRGRPDIFLPVAFLTSRVAKTDTDDWKKLKRVLCYLNSTKDLSLTLSADSLNVTKWWVDASFAVRHDFKSQTGSGMSMGRGMVMSKSAKQKLVTKSSTEAELVGASDTVAQMIWTRYFLEAQGYKVDKAVLFQDNKSAILLERNGRLSSSSRTRHVNIRYFFVKDRITSGELSVEHCPTDEMLADFHTKPLQGSKFIQFRDMILGISPIAFDVKV